MVRIPQCLVLAVAFSLAAGCARVADESDVPPDPDAQSTAPVASVALANGNVVEFYEVSPGEIVVSETGPIDNPFTFTAQGVATRSPLELYRSLPGAPAEPPAFREAVARYDAQRSAKVVEGERTGTSAQALSTGVLAGSCSDAYLFARGGPNLGGTMGSRETSHTERVYDKNLYQFTLCVHAGQTGSVSMDAYTRPWYTWNKQGYWVTSPGTFRWWSETNQSVDFDAQTRFWNGSALSVDYFVNCWPAGYNCYH